MIPVRSFVLLAVELPWLLAVVMLSGEAVWPGPLLWNDSSGICNYLTKSHPPRDSYALLGRYALAHTTHMLLLGLPTTAAKGSELGQLRLQAILTAVIGFEVAERHSVGLQGSEATL